MRLPLSLTAWGSPEFAAVLKRELEQLGPRALPLQQAASMSSHVLDEACEVMVLGSAASRDAIHARLGVFFAGVVAGCSCADDPTPIEAQNEYCELALAIDRVSAEASVSLSEAPRDGEGP